MVYNDPLGEIRRGHLSPHGLKYQPRRPYQRINCVLSGGVKHENFNYAPATATDHPVGINASMRANPQPVG